MPVILPTAAAATVSCSAPLLLLLVQRQRGDKVEVEENVAPPPRKATSPNEARCEVLVSKALLGQDKWLGGVSSFCGKYIYGVPGKSQRVLRIALESGVVDEIG